MQYYVLIDNLLNSIDNSDVVKSLLEKKSNLYKNKEVMNLINNYNISIKKKIDETVEVKEFRSIENEVNFMILEINKRLKQLTR